MSTPLIPPITLINDPWQRLREKTRARIGLGRAGSGQPTAPMLDFQEAHALARDAVHTPFDAAGMAKRLSALTSVPALRVISRADNRATYLHRPDLGRRLDETTSDPLPPGPYDIAFVIGDGLSATAVHDHAVPFLEHVLAHLTGWRIAPMVVASQARVALGDPIGAAMGARMVAVVIGERPGLTAADSLGVYLTYAPKPGRQDGERNCLSNIHPPDGLSYAEAAGMLVDLIRGANALGTTGVGLKLDATAAPTALNKLG